MSAQAIPAALEAEVIAKSMSGWSLRRIVEWLASEKKITASWISIASLLRRSGPTAAAAALEQEPVRQYKDIVPALMESLDRVEEYLKQIIEDTTMLPAYRRITTQLSAVRSWQRIIMFKLRICGYGGAPRSRAAQTEPTTAPKAAQTPAPAPANPAPAHPVTAASNIAATIAAAVATPVAPTPSRNGPCPCGSTKKYKACHGKPNKASGSGGT